ncbi:MAG TPA: XRE family transcriptional regulator, partial [Lachnospiraceae bacterium]|nr:XRE family transcriptional regulator [Lachnospiraceae bacterium]
MDCVKIGKLIAKLRKEKNLTQRNIADALGIQNKTVSKWECGLGCPDLSLWPELSA